MGPEMPNSRRQRDAPVSWPSPTLTLSGGPQAALGAWLGRCPLSAHPRQAPGQTPQHGRHPLQCLGKPYRPELKQGFHRQRKINTRIPHHLFYLQSGAALSPGSNKETQHRYCTEIPQSRLVPSTQGSFIAPCRAGWPRAGPNLPGPPSSPSCPLPCRV